MLEAEFSRLYRSYSPRLLRQLQRQYPRFAEEAEDVVQDVFRKLWERCAASSSTVSPAHYPDVPEAWLSRSATNGMIDICRSTRSVSKPSNSSPRHATPELMDASSSTSVEDGADEREGAARRDKLLRAMHACLECMPPHERTLLILKYLEGLSYAEIAHRTGYSRGSLGTLLLRARRNVYESIMSAQDGKAE